MADIQVVEASLEQVGVVVDMWLELMQFHWERDARFTLCDGAEETFRDYARQYVEREDGLLLLALVNDYPAGYATARFASTPPVFIGQQTALLEDMLIRKRFRRIGLGRLLTQRVIEWAQNNNRDHVQLQVADCNPEGHAFWREMGFQDVTRLMRFELGSHVEWDRK